LAVMVTTIACLASNRIELTALRAAAHTDRRAFIGGLAVDALDVARAQPAAQGLPVGILGTSVTTSDLAGRQSRSVAT
jgi:hypothetical protein